MRVELTDVRGKKTVYELDVPPAVARLLVRRDQMVEFQGVQYGFLSTSELRTRYCPVLPPAHLGDEMLVGSHAVTGQ
jgi:hypothetical protein